MENHNPLTLDELAEELAQTRTACDELEAAAGRYASIFDRFMLPLAAAAGIPGVQDPEVVLPEAIARLVTQDGMIDRRNDRLNQPDDGWKGACMALAQVVADNPRLGHLMPIGLEVSVTDLITQAITYLSRDLDNAEAEVKSLRERLQSEQQAHGGTFARLKAAQREAGAAYDILGDASLAVNVASDVLRSVRDGVLREDVPEGVAETAVPEAPES
jgi:hypothetical protein